MGVDDQLLDDGQLVAWTNTDEILLAVLAELRGLRGDMRASQPPKPKKSKTVSVDGK